MSSFLLLAALLPAAVLLLQVYRLDKIEKEPQGLLLKLLGGGAVSGIVAYFAEWAAMGLLMKLRPEQDIWFLILQNFLAVALVEEVCKRLPVMLFAWNNKAFDYRFDAVVYCVFSALGFAALENILYVAESGFGTAVSRALLSVPGHCFFAVYMGIYLGEAKQAERDGEGYEMDGLKRASLLVPMLLHGFWDFCLSVQNWKMALLFYVFVLIFFISANSKLRRASESDRRIF